MTNPLAIRFGLLVTLLSGVGTLEAVVVFDFTTVGDVGNAADTRIMDKGAVPDSTTGYGSVGYEYKIATKHVTNSQYVEFLNAVDPNGVTILSGNNGIYNPNMSASTIGGATGTAYTGGIDLDFGGTPGSKYSVKAGQDDLPANWINWNSGARFVNWLHNGQGSGDSENGVYDMSISTTEPPPRQEGAKFFIPSEDEFYKAAYYDPNKGSTGGYWEYGIGSETPPLSEAPSGGATSANYRSPTDTYWQNGASFDDSLDYRTEVGAYSNATSHYGLLDVDGLLHQWTEGTKESSFSDPLPVYRGGSWFYGPDFNGASSRNLYSFRGAASYAWFGLRIAAPDDEPSNLPGDANSDGKVDLLDLDILGSNFGSTGGTFGTGDFNEDGVVDLLDLDILGSNFGAMASTSIPEPAGVLLMLVGAGLMLGKRSGR